MKPYLTATAGIAALAIAPALYAGPTKLAPEDLARITAGSEYNSNPAPNGGAIVGNGSTATLVSTGEVNIADEAQSDARALNLVNSSESTVANGVNVFDGRTDANAAIDGSEFNISQQNVIEQDQRRLSSLPSYQRGANTETFTTDSGSSMSESSSSLVDQVTDVDTSTVIDAATTAGGFDRSAAPTLRVDASGSLQIGSVYDLDGSYSAEFNMPSAAGAVGVLFNGELEYGIDGGDITLDTGDLGLVATLNLPELNLDFDAMGCVAVNGNCSIDATRTESTEDVRDQSTLYTTDESSSSAETWDRSSHEVVNAPFELADAQAEYVVVDESSIDVAASYLVSLAGSAQSGLRAMNAVNAAGSAVANGVNVSLQRSGDLAATGAPVYNLNQINDITHSR